MTVNMPIYLFIYLIYKYTQLLHTLVCLQLRTLFRPYETTYVPEAGVLIIGMLFLLDLHVDCL